MEVSVRIAYNDASFVDPWDLWGTGVDTAGRCPTPIAGENMGARTRPLSGKKRTDVGRLVADLALSTNAKTTYCFSQWFDTCSPTKWCKEYCYGLGVRFRCGNTPALLKKNRLIMNAIASGKISSYDVEQLAVGIYQLCMQKGIDNLRWHGVGDMNRGSFILASTVARMFPDFKVWGFTRRGDMLLDMIDVGELPNIVFWGSTDYTMPPARLHSQARLAAELGTGLAFASAAGERRRPSNMAKPVKTKIPADAYEADMRFRDNLWRIASEYGIGVHVAHGYHGKGVVTSLGVPNECPATNPLDTGHRHDACQACRWCMNRPSGGDLQSHWRAVDAQLPPLPQKVVPW